MTGEATTVDTMDTEPDHTAVRVALWRALHLEADAPPHVFEDDFALRLADPGEGWRRRPDMDPDGTRPFRAGVVSRARFVEDLVAEQAGRSVGQYVLLGAGLDTFVQRRPDLAARLRVFEIDQPGTQAWKRRRLLELGHPVPDSLRLVPVDFESGQSWWDRLVAAGFDPAEPAVVASTGVSMYLAKETTRATLRQLARLAAGSTVAMTFLLPPELLDEADRPGLKTVRTGAKASGTPFVSLYPPREMLEMARETGFTDIRHVPGTALSERYFAGRPDGLRPSSGEDFLVAAT
ncbi:methyltransferase, TIGR00027 family [Amycolatopsis saalfeldensis]|uniref:S-adenosyl-L-methionine-dependent methyltransferase n=2 Tax=Amycolatopsis saalfeldensis TaxID=394193 RepID=A0A1H8UYB7_9PSEU|nr:methyltransferase, TIGR00027 family [Amycolatopsis saalfeldensis]